MNISVIYALMALAPIGVVLVFLYRTLASRQEIQLPVDELLVLSADKYRPMARMLQEDDFQFLSTQPGFSPRMGRQFRTQRRRIFRAYLRSLSIDFSRLSMACHNLIIHAADDRGDLAKSLMRQRLMFTVGMVAIQGRLLLHTAGVGTVDVSGLVDSFAAMQGQIQMLLTPPQIAMARM